MEYRQDPIVERWVIIAPGRSLRPHEFVEKMAVERSGACPFCAGHEGDTPAEIAALRDPGSPPGGPGWRVRAVLNKFPFLSQADGLPSATSDKSAAWGAFVSSPAAGPHEVLIDSPRHVVRAGQLSVAETADVLRLYRLRLATLRREGRFPYVQIFKNVGDAAGASIEHLHGQLTALSFVPPQVAAEVAALRAHRERSGRCAHCDVLAAELAAGVRVVETTPRFAVVCPYASGFSYEMQIVPRLHAGGFDRLDDEALEELAGVLRRTLVRLDGVLPSVAYNLLLVGEPFDSFAASYYHWRMAIVPRTAKTAGFEWSTGILVNPVPPEEAATQLRAAPFDPSQ